MKQKKVYSSWWLTLLAILLSAQPILAADAVESSVEMVFFEDFSTGLPLIWFQPVTDPIFGQVVARDGRMIISSATYGCVDLYNIYSDAIYEVALQVLEESERPIRFSVRKTAGDVPWHADAGYGIVLWEDKIAFEISPAINQFVVEQPFVDDEGNPLSYNWMEPHTLQIHVLANQITVYVRETDGSYTKLGEFVDESFLGGAVYTVGRFGIFTQKDLAIDSFAVFKAESPVGPIRPVSGESGGEVDAKGLDQVWIGPKAFVSGREVRDDFIEILTDPEQWMTVLASADVFKSYIMILPAVPIPGQSEPEISDQQLRALIQVLDDHELKVAFEVGGARDHLPGSGLARANADFVHLRRWLDLGGRIDYLSTDHTLGFAVRTWMKTMSERNLDYTQPAVIDAFLRNVAEQTAAYFARLSELIPGVRLGLIDSLGYFHVKGIDGRQYVRTVADLPIIHFSDYLDYMIAAMDGYGLQLDHKHIDFGYGGVKSEGRRSGMDMDYGRMLGVEAYTQAQGITVGVIFNAFHDEFYGRTSPTREAGNRQSYDNTVTFLRGYLDLEDGNCEQYVLQTWQPYPDLTGPEDKPYTVMNMFRTLLEIIETELE